MGLTPDGPSAAPSRRSRFRTVSCGVPHARHTIFTAEPRLATRVTTIDDMPRPMTSRDRPPIEARTRGGVVAASTTPIHQAPSATSTTGYPAPASDNLGAATHSDDIGDVNSSMSVGRHPIGRWIATLIDQAGRNVGPPSLYRQTSMQRRGLASSTDRRPPAIDGGSATDRASIWFDPGALRRQRGCPAENARTTPEHETRDPQSDPMCAVHATT